MVWGTFNPKKTFFNDTGRALSKGLLPFSVAGFSSIATFDAICFVLVYLDTGSYMIGCGF